VGALRALRGEGVVIKAENDWQDGRPQVAMHHYLQPVAVVVVVVNAVLVVVAVVGGVADVA